MARSSRGGKRVGKIGAAYSARTDLNKARTPQAIQTGPSTAYGQATAAKQAQKVVPIAPVNPGPAGPPSPGLSSAASGAAPGSPAPAGGAGANPMSAPAPPAPGTLGDLLRPTENPGEPVTHGLPFGPGAGPEALQAFQPTPSPLLAALASLNGAQNSSPLVKAVAAQVNALQQASTGR